MINQVLLVFIGIFSIIGLISTLYCIVEVFYNNKNSAVPGELVVFVKDMENEVEGLVRIISRKLDSGDTGIAINTLSVIDYGSQDETKEILQKLEKDIDILNYYTKEDYIKHISDYNKIQN